MIIHSPTPWKVDGASIRSDGLYVAELSSPLGGDVRDANAAFIVKAVNNHAALVAVVTQLLAAYDAGNLQMCSPEIGEPENDIPMHSWHEELLHHARQALEGCNRPVGRTGDPS